MDKNDLSHVLWIGGGTDAGKSTSAHEYAKRNSFAVYHYDHVDKRQQKTVATNSTIVEDFQSASMDERWVYPEPKEMLAYLLALFPLRFELVLEDLRSMPNDKIIVVEGFGILPELIAPYLSHRNQAIWLVPTLSFKKASMDRRGKPSFASETSDPARAKRNLLERDMLLVEHIQESLDRSNYALHVTDGALSIEQTIDLLESHFGSYIDSSRRLTALAPDAKLG